MKRSSTRADTVAELRRVLDQAQRLMVQLDASAEAARTDAADEAVRNDPLDDLPPDDLLDGTARKDHLEQRLASSEAEVTTLGEQLVGLEHRAHQLMNLYVATYQLYAARELEEVQDTIAEIARDLVGAKTFVLLLGEPGQDATRSLAVACREGDTERFGELFADDRYAGGLEPVDRVLRGDGPGDEAGSDVVAVVPLRFDDLWVGVLVVLELLGHKEALSPGDREILDLLGAHAASALATAMTYNATTRKLQTMESLVKLVKGES